MERSELHSKIFFAFPNPSKQQKSRTRFSNCPRNKNCITFYCCSSCSSPICLEHANLQCEDCSQFEKQQLSYIFEELYSYMFCFILSACSWTEFKFCFDIICFSRKKYGVILFHHTNHGVNSPWLF